MMEIQSVPIRLYTKILSTLIAGTVGMSGIGYSANIAYDRIAKGDVFSEGAFIGPVSVKGNNRIGAKQTLEQATEQWLKQGKIKFKWNEKEVQLDTSLCSFDVLGSVQKASLMGKSKLLININEAALTDFVQKSFDVKLDQVDWARLRLLLSDKVSTNLLTKQPITVDLKEFTSSASASVPQDTVASYEIVVPYDIPDVKRAVEKLDGLEIKPKAAFSLLQTLADQKIDLSSTDTANIIASAIYGAALKTNFEIIERHTGRRLPIYTELGFESYVVPGKMDLVIKNPNDKPYTLHFVSQPQRVKVVFLGAPLPYHYEVVVEDKKEYAPKTILHYSNELQGSGQKVVEEGNLGQSGNVFRVIRNGDQIVEKQSISEDFYFPVYRIVEQPISSDPILNQMNSLPMGQAPSSGVPSSPQTDKVTDDKSVKPSVSSPDKPDNPSTNSTPGVVIGKKI